MKTERKRSFCGTNTNTNNDSAAKTERKRSFCGIVQDNDKNKIAKIARSSMYLFTALLVLCTRFAVSDETSKYIDKTISPGYDFFLHANGKWLNEMKAGNVSCNALKNVEYEMQMMDQCTNGTSTYANAVSMMYNSLVAPDVAKSMNGLKDYLNLLEIGDYSLEKIPWLIAAYTPNGAGHILNISTITRTQDIDERPNTKLHQVKTTWSVLLNRSDATITNADIDSFLKLMQTSRLPNSYTDSIKEFIPTINSEIVSAFKQASNPSFPKTVKKEELVEIMTKAGWSSYLQQSGLLTSNTSEVEVDSVDFSLYLTSLNAVFKKYKMAQIKIYLQFLIFLNYKQFLDIKKHDESDALKIVTSIFGYDLQDACYGQYARDNTQQKIWKIFDNVKAAYKEAISSTTWMSKETKDKMLTKLDNIWVSVGNSNVYHVNY